MPLVRYEIRSEHSLANPDLYRSAKDEPEGLLEGVAVAGLVGIVRQIGDLAEFAADIFRDLHEEVMAVSSRSHDLAIRVQQIEAEMPSIEKALLSETNQLKFAYNRGTEWHASIRADQNHCTQGDLPRFIRNSYEECRGPPKLFLLDRFDVAGAGACLKRYTDPSYFKTEWASSELMKAEQAQRDSKAKRGKKKARRRKGSNESVDSIPVTQINSRVRYSSRGIETDGASGSSSSLNSEYLSKQKELAPTDSLGASSSSSSKGSRVPLSIIQGQETGVASRAPVTTAYLKQPRVALPTSRGVESSGSGSGSPPAEQLAKPARQVQPPSQQRIEVVSGSSTVHQGFQSREALPPSLGVGNSVQVPSPNLVGSTQSGKASGSKLLSPAIATDEPLKLSAKDIEAESLSGRFVKVQQKANVDVVQENDTQQVAVRQSDEHSFSATPVSAPLQDEPAHPTSYQQALYVQTASDYDGNDGSEQKERADSAEDIAGEVENFVDALATMDSDGETDAETRTSESRPRVNADADDDEVQSKLVDNVQDVEASPEVLIQTQPDLLSHAVPRIEVSSPKVQSPSPLNAELFSAEMVALSGEEPLSPTESSARLSPSNRTVDSADLISPCESSMGFSSPGTFPEVVTPRSSDTAISEKVEGNAMSLGLSTPGQEPLPSVDLPTSPQVLSAPLQAPVELMGLPTWLPSCADTSADTFTPGKSDDRPPSPRGLSATPSSPDPALFLPSQAASNSAVGSVSVPAIDLPSPTGTVIVLASPSIVGRAPWDLSSQAGSMSELSTPRKVEGYAHELASPTGSTSDTSSLYKVQSPPGLNLGIPNLDLDGGGAPARDLPSPLGSLPTIGRESPSFEDSGVQIPSPVALQEASEFAVAEDPVSPRAEAEAEHQHLPGESSEKMESVGGVVTEHLSEVKQGYSSRSGPEAGFEEKPLSPIEESTDEVLVDQRDEDLASHQEVSADTSEEDTGALKVAVMDKEYGETKLNPADPLLHLLSSEEDPEDELDAELAEAAGSQQLPLSPSPASSPSPRAHKFSVLDPLSLSDGEGKDPGSSPRGSDGSSPRSSVFSALNSPMSPPLQSRKFMKSPEPRRGRSFRASEVVSPVSPTHGSRVPLLRSPASQAMPEILPLLPPMNPGQWQGLSAYHERRHSVPVEFGRSPARVPPAPPIPQNRNAQTTLPTSPMPTRRAPVPGQQSVIDAIAAHDKSKLKKVPPSPSKLSSDLDREVMLQQIRTQSFSLRDTKSVPRAKSESPQRPVTNINVAAILEKANAIRQAFTGSDEDDDEDDQWSDK